MKYSFWRGYEIVWKDDKWFFTDTMEPIPGYGGLERPCKKCGLMVKSQMYDDSDPCLGDLPGVDNACCGHGIREQSYIRFTNGVVVKGFIKE